MDAKTLVNCIDALPTRQAILIRGDHGVGKSQIVQALARRRKKNIIDVRASTMSEGDVVGYPDLERTKETGVASFALPSWYVRACNEGVVLFLDELNRGLPGVLNSFFQIVLDRELGSGPDGKPMRLHPAHLRPTKAVEPGKVAPNQRSWEMLDRALKNVGIDLTEHGGAPPSILYPLSTGFIGVEASAALVDFVTSYQSMVTADDVLNRWNPTLEKKVRALSTEKQLAIIEKVKDHCKAEEWTVDQAKRLYGFFSILTGDLKLALFNGVLGTGRTKNVSKFHHFAQSETMAIINAAQAVNAKK